MRQLWLCPSRNRPANIQRLTEAWIKTHAQADLLVRVDDDDEHVQDYENLFIDLDPSQFIFQVGPRLKLGPTLNDLAPKFTSDYGAIGFLGDDHLPRTFEWDHHLGEALRKMRGGLVYGNDLLQRVNLPTAVLISSTIINALGFYVPPGQTHLYLDDFWRDLGRRLDRLAYLDDVIIEHVHPAAGKAQMDGLYAEVNAPSMYEGDALAYGLYRDERMDLDVEKVKAALTNG